MAVKLRLRRLGRRKRPMYSVVAADSRSPRDGRFIEDLGRYNPLNDPASLELKSDRLIYWLEQGAQPTDTVRSLLSRDGIMLALHMRRKGKSEEEISSAVEQHRAQTAEKIGKGALTAGDRRKQALEEERKRAAAREAEEAKARAAAAKKAEAEKAEAAAEEAEVDQTEERAGSEEPATSSSAEVEAAASDTGNAEAPEEAEAEPAPVAEAEAEVATPDEVVEEGSTAAEGAGEESVTEATAEPAAEDESESSDEEKSA